MMTSRLASLLHRHYRTTRKNTAPKKLQIEKIQIKKGSRSTPLQAIFSSRIQVDKPESGMVNLLKTP